jgi:hypothetical protein
VNGEIGLEDLPSFVQLQEAVFGDCDKVATVERNMRVTEQMNCEFSEYYVKFQGIATDLDWNGSALPTALKPGLSEEIKDSIIYSDMPKDLPRFVSVCQKMDHLIR